MTETATLAWAKHYLSLGLHPIPVRRGTKKAAVAWKKYQTTAPTPAQLQAWFKDGDNSVALVLGRGLIAVDLDGEGAEEELAAAGVTLPQGAPRSITSAGFHVLLRADGELGDRVNLLKKKERADGKLVKPLVDIRGVGYIVAPPSVHPSGHVYEWEIRPDGEVPAAPEPLLALIRGSASPAKASKTGLAAPGTPDWIASAMEGVGEGRRDDTCARLAGYLLSKGHPADIVAGILYAFSDRCTPPFPRAEVDKTVASVAAKERARAEETPPEDFQVLGYNGGGYFYLPAGSSQVVELRADQHTKLHLLRLAPLQFWERSYASKAGVQWDMAANALLRFCEARGVYDTSRVRGRGAWWEEDRAVLHLGDRLIDRGQSISVIQARSERYIYEAASPIRIDMERPLPIDEANRVVDVAELVNWEKPISARLLAGWCVVAPICGALAWRPHVWLTGPAGSGKSWVIENIIRRLLGEIGLSVQSETTEAGLRQTLGQDARPVTFDEIEGDDQRAQQRIQNVLALARQASSEGGAIIIKGTPGGAAKSYRIRSCFAFSSIGVGLQHHADATRVTVLSVERRNDPEKFARLCDAVIGIDDEFSQRFIARSIRLAPVIRANAHTFALAGAAHLGSRRLGDQIGALLAGCYSLFDEGLADAEAASAWIAEQDWSEQNAVGEQTDEVACLNHLLEQAVRVSTFRGLIERSVASLVRAAGGHADGIVSPGDAEQALALVGVRVDDDTFTVSASHSGLRNIFEGTRWSQGWGRVLRRVAGATATAGTVRFDSTKSRGVEIPMEVLEQ